MGGNEFLEVVTLMGSELCGAIRVQSLWRYVLDIVIHYERSSTLLLTEELHFGHCLEFS